MKTILIAVAAMLAFSSLATAQGAPTPTPEDIFGGTCPPAAEGDSCSIALFLPTSGDPTGGDDDCGVDDGLVNPPNYSPPATVVLGADPDPEQVGTDCWQDHATLTFDANGDVTVAFANPVDLPVAPFSDGQMFISGFNLGLDGDLDGDGDDDATELLSCLSNPFNPAATCKDADGDGLVYYIEAIGAGETFATDLECTAADGFPSEGECIFDEETDCDGKADPGLSCDHNFWDTDRDGLSDSADPYPTDPTNRFVNLDPDGDGLDAEQEVECGTDPNKGDSDGDGLRDGSALDPLNECLESGGTDPTNPDTDGDGQNEGRPGQGDPFPLDATRKDTDFDLLLDSEETSGDLDLAFRKNPTGAAAGTAYALPSTFVADNYCTNHPDGGPSSRSDGADGPDEGTEFDVCSPVASNEGATDPNDADSDGDGLTDGDERLGTFSAATAEECFDASAPGPQTDPNNADTDGDGYDDYAENCGAMLIKGDPTDAGSWPDQGNVIEPLSAAGAPDQCETLPETCEGTPLDLADPWDTDGDGKRQEPNGQADLVEQRLAYVDPDEADDSSREKNADLEGEGGVTIVVLNPAESGTHKMLARIHLGDVSASEDATELLVIHAGETYTCVYTVGSELRVAIGGTAFTPASEDPCGPNFSAVLFPEENDAGLPVDFEDADRDQVPETFAVPDLTSEECETIEDAFPDPTSCPMGEPTEIGELPIGPEDVVTVLCGTPGAQDIASAADLCPAPEPGPLAAEAGGPYSGAKDTAISITGSANRESGYTCAWSGTGATFASSTSCATTVTYTAVGEKTITLEVTEGATTVTDTATVTVTEASTSEPECIPDGLPDCAPSLVPDPEDVVGDPVGLIGGLVGEIFGSLPGLAQCVDDVPALICIEDDPEGGPLLYRVNDLGVPVPYAIHVNFWGFNVHL